MSFYEHCDELLPRRNQNIDILLKHAGTHAHYLRRRVCAKILSTIHVLKALFTGEWARAIGTQEQVLDRLPESYHSIVEELAVKDRYILGNFAHWDAIVYELLCLLAYNDLRFSVCTSHIESLLISEYHMIRPAVDAMDSKVLNICIMSTSYFSTIWSTYMRTYYPSIFKRQDVFEGDAKTSHEDHVRTLALPRWTSLHFYLPNADFAESHNLDELLAFLVDFFQGNITDEFLFSFKKIRMPSNYSILVNEVFKKDRSVLSLLPIASRKRQLPTRACVRPAIIDTKTRRRR